jgi:hypothetical protein
MKKLLLGALLLLSSFVSFSQDTFVVEYTSCISIKDDVKEPWKELNVTVVFNEKSTSDIVLYYGGGKVIRYKKTGSLVKDKTVVSEDYQYMECIDVSDGTTVGVQYFEETETLRIIISKGWYVEFHK